MLILRGGYTDVSPGGSEEMTAGRIRFRSANHRHTVQVHKGGAWSLFVTGPETRQWGFWVKDKLIKANRYFHKFGDHVCD